MMIKTQYSLIAAMLLLAAGCGRNGAELPKTFKDHEVAIEQVEAASFEIEETIQTPESSWIQSATFRSSDDRMGFFLLTAKNKKYIYQDVPRELWEGFKKADSKGGYYNRHIKGRYQLKR